MDGGINTRSRGNLNMSNNNLIGSIVLTASGALNFTNIPQIYNHLEIWGVMKTTQAVTNALLGVQFNGDTAANYSWVQFNYFGGGSNTSSSNTAAFVAVGFFSGSSCPANDYSVVKIWIPCYRSFSFNKLAEGYVSSGNTGLNIGAVCGGDWRNLSAINSVNIVNGSSVGTTFMAGSQAYLYGIN